jgi:hypothetical protein
MHVVVAISLRYLSTVTLDAPVLAQGSAVMSLLSRWSLYGRWELFVLFV